MRCVPAAGGLVCVSGPLTRPDIDAVEAFRRSLEEQHRMTEQHSDPAPSPVPEPAGVDLGAAGVAGWYAVLEQVAKKREELNGIEEQAQDAIKAVLGDQVDGLINGEPVLRWLHTAAPKKFNRKQLAKDYPDIEKKYVVFGEPGRRFELVKPKAVK